MANRAKEIIRAVLGCRDPQGICGSPVYKVPNYRAMSSRLCTPNFATLVNSNGNGVQTYAGDSNAAGGAGCCDDSCGGAAGKIPVSTKLPVSTAPTSGGISSTSSGSGLTFGTASSAPNQPSFFGG